MSMSVEEFASRCKLNTEEIQALQDILGNEKIMQMAEHIARSCFYPSIRGTAPEYPETDELSKAWFAACYLGAESAEQHYAAKGIPEEVLLESMTDLGIWLRNAKRNYGVIGLRQARPWEADVFHGSVIRHGRLECNYEYHYTREPIYDSDGNVLLTKGDAVINMHIPEDGPMDIDECKKSMERMRVFFEEYRPDYNWKGFLCESWLLDSQLRTMLSPDSNIIKFQDMGYRYDIAECDGTVFRVFGTRDPESIKDPTTLQRNALAFMKAGGKFRSEGLFIPR